MNKIVYVVHNIDTEGPLNETINATFKRLKSTFNINLKPTLNNLKKLQKKEIFLNGLEKPVANFVSEKRLNFLKNWSDLKKNINIITEDKFRNKLPDSFGNPWIFNWFCMDHVGFNKNNPRQRAMGDHKIYDFYFNLLKEKKACSKDIIQWHYHPLAIKNDLNRTGNTYLNSNNIYNILSKKIIDRNFFPSTFRPGFHTERPDSHWFLEQWIPFDYGNQSSILNKDKDQSDLANGRSGNWQNAPLEWLPYNPDFYDYKKRGSCKRYIARCLNIDARIRSIQKHDIEQAFKEAKIRGHSLLSFTNHDYRDMRAELEDLWKKIILVSGKFKNVKFKYVNAIDGMRNNIKNFKSSIPVNLKCRISYKNTHCKLTVSSSKSIHGTQPYLAIKDKKNNYFWNNFDFINDYKWSFTFDENNIEIDDVKAIGIAANSCFGKTEIINYKLDINKKFKYVLN